MASMDKTNSQDHCASLALDENNGKRRTDMKPALLMFSPSASQPEFNPSSVPIPYAYFDPHVTGLYAAYPPHIVPHGVGAVSGRVALSVGSLEDGPIYVNAKQYHGILRRRQMRAKLEAENKLVKTRKPYLHESRHVHALNRVRGSGGRFLSAKKSQQPNTHPPSCSQSTDSRPPYDHQNLDLSSGDFRRFKASKHNIRPIAEGISPDSMTPNIPSHLAVSMQGSGSLMYSGNHHFASIVR